MNSPVAGTKPNIPSVPMGQAMAPKPEPIDPMEKLKALIDPSHWHVLQNLLNWAIMWENTRQGLVTPYNDQTKMVMLAPWRSFDAHPTALKNLTHYCTGAFLSAYGQYEADAVYRKANPMPWIVLQIVAPAFAAVCTQSQEGNRAAWDIILELRKIDELPLEPDDDAGRPKPGAT